MIKSDYNILLLIIINMKKNNVFMKLEYGTFNKGEHRSIKSANSLYIVL